jgi:hypothetical protein
MIRGNVPEVTFCNDKYTLREIHRVPPATIQDRRDEQGPFSGIFRRHQAGTPRDVTADQVGMAHQIGE